MVVFVDTDIGRALNGRAARSAVRVRLDVVALVDVNVRVATRSSAAARRLIANGLALCAAGGIVLRSIFFVCVRGDAASSMLRLAGFHCLLLAEVVASPRSFLEPCDASTCDGEFKRALSMRMPSRLAISVATALLKPALDMTSHKPRATSRCSLMIWSRIASWKCNSIFFTPTRRYCERMRRKLGDLPSLMAASMRD